MTLVVMLCFAFAFSQTTVKGKVTDDTGQTPSWCQYHHCGDNHWNQFRF
jgi:hypothetical protein